MKHFLIFGSHPLLSHAEATAILAQTPLLAGKSMAIFETETWDGEVLQSRLAGITKLGDILYEMPLNNVSLEELADWTLRQHTAGKLHFGFTVYGGTDAQRIRVENFALPFKRLLQASHLPVRWVTGKEGKVSPAAVDKLNLTEEGYDFVFGIIDQTVYIGRTTHVQDATAWSTRDYGRPFRDTKTGMLPPKLARLMINLGCQTYDPATLTILDPFCGGGTVLMEATLLHVGHIIGSDIDARQVQGSENNADWLVDQRIITQEQRERITLLTASVQKIGHDLAGTEVDVIVTEGYLGHPRQGNETTLFLNKQKQEIEKLWIETLTACATLQPRGSRMICIWPTYVTKTTNVEIDVSDRLNELGYQKIQTEALVYGRDDQHIKRQIIILERL